MDSNKYKYLSFTSFKDLVLWSAAGIIFHSIKYNPKYTLVPICSFLKRSTHVITLEDGTKYTRLTIKTNNGGIVVRDRRTGSEIGTKKQNVVRVGQFVISKIDARNGAFGIIPQYLDGAIVTNDFPTFDVNVTVINPTYLLLLTTTKEFMRFAQTCSSGTTNRQRIDLNLLLSKKIPLPSLEEQDKIVSEYCDKIRKAQDLEQEAIQIEEGVKHYFMEVLGVTTNQKKEKKENIFKYT